MLFETGLENREGTIFDRLAQMKDKVGDFKLEI